jgi:tRNA(Ile)-lysidine synthase
MASSRKSKSSSLSSRAEKILRGQIERGNHLIVALSGGVDSVVLLDLLAALSPKMQFTLSAVHVNHGISSNADQWSKFCRDLCRTLDIPLKIARLKISREPGVSLEEAARDARYQVFGKLKADYVVLAQHLDDQAETLLLQLLRGAGAKGLGAMPLVREQASDLAPRILRPLLEVPRSEIEIYARNNQLHWITDESNADVSFDRNFLRHEIFPVLEQRFPSYRTTFLRTSRHLAEASALLDELAAADGNNCSVAGKLQVEGLRKLDSPRAKNLLRHTLAQQGITLPSTVKLEEILRQLLSSRPDAKLHIAFGNTEIRCFKGALHVRPLAVPATTDWLLAWRGEKLLAIPELGGTVSFLQRKGTGINLSKLMEKAVTIRLRQGGERLRPDCKRPRRSLKNLLQEAALPPWEREMLPLLFSGKHLVWVPGIGIDYEFQAAAGEPGLMVKWHRN